jgi:phycocyanobilin:ferredoxin oxidoreductase
VRCRASASSPAPPASEWRLADAGLAPAFLQLARGIEAQWRSHPGMAAPLATLPVDPRFEVVDSGAAAERLRIENRFYTTPTFRKCHLELAVGGAGLNVLHCVMYPWAAHDLPLFSVDMVGFGVRAGQA